MDNTSDFDRPTQSTLAALIRVPTLIVLHLHAKPPVVWPVNPPVNLGPNLHHRLPTRRRMAFNAPWAAINPPNPTPVPNPPVNSSPPNHVAAANPAPNPVSVANPTPNPNQVVAANPAIVIPPTAASSFDENELDDDEEDAGMEY